MELNLSWTLSFFVCLACRRPCDSWEALPLCLSCLHSLELSRQRDFLFDRRYPALHSSSIAFKGQAARQLVGLYLKRGGALYLRRLLLQSEFPFFKPVSEDEPPVLWVAAPRFDARACEINLILQLFGCSKGRRHFGFYRARKPYAGYDIRLLSVELKNANRFHAEAYEWMEKGANSVSVYVLIDHV